MRRAALAIAAAFALAATAARGQEPPSHPAEPRPLANTGPLRLDLPVLDLPFNVSSAYWAPSPSQALALARDFSTGADWAVDLGFQGLAGGDPARRSWTAEWLVLAGVALVTLELPFFSAWSHEEMHRSVLARRGIGSRNGVWDLHLFSESISVYGVADGDLARLKAEHPAEMARLAAAGMEGDIELARSVAADNFFDRRDWRVDVTMLLLLRVSVVAYMFTCDSAEGDRFTDEANAREPDPLERDIVGLDCTSWAYDLQRPDEPYAARGPHPSGVGVNRYRKRTDLTSGERPLLSQAAWLSLLDLADLSIWPVSFPVPWDPEGGRFTFGLAQEMASFGQALILDLYWRLRTASVRTTARVYLSEYLALPGLEVEWVRLPLPLGPARLDLTVGAMLWLQPSSGRYAGRTAAAGGQIKVRAGVGLAPRVGAYAEIQAKTAGWVAGTLPLEAAVELRLGLAAVL